MNMKRDVIEEVAVIGPAEPVQIDMDNVDRFRTAFERAIEEGDRDVVLNASNVEFFDSAGLGALLSLQKQVQERGGRMVLAGLNRSVGEVFRMVGFDMVFATYPDPEQAVDSLK